METGNTHLHIEHVRCRICERLYKLVISIAGWNAWRAGELIQRALPELSDDERELLVSGICGPCFDKLFAEDGADPDGDPIEVGIDATGFRE